MVARRLPLRLTGPALPIAPLACMQIAEIVTFAVRNELLSIFPVHAIKTLCMPRGLYVVNARWAVAVAI